MNIEVRQPAVAQKTRLKIIDVDIHPKRSIEDLRPYLSDRWWTHLQTYGTRQRQGFLKGFAWTLLNPFKFESVDSTLESVDNFRILEN